MYTCICILYVYKCIYVYTHVYICIYTRVYVYMCVHVCIYMYIYAYTCMCMHAYIYTYMYRDLMLKKTPLKNLTLLMMSSYIHQASRKKPPTVLDSPIWTVLSPALTPHCSLLSVVCTSHPWRRLLEVYPLSPLEYTHNQSKLEEEVLLEVRGKTVCHSGITTLSW